MSSRTMGIGITSLCVGLLDMGSYGRPQPEAVPRPAGGALVEGAAIIDGRALGYM